MCLNHSVAGVGILGRYLVSVEFKEKVKWLIQLGRQIRGFPLSCCFLYLQIHQFSLGMCLIVFFSHFFLRHKDQWEGSTESGTCHQARDLNSMSGTHTVEGELNAASCPLIPGYALWHVNTHK